MQDDQQRVTLSPGGTLAVNRTAGNQVVDLSVHSGTQSEVQAQLKAVVQKSSVNPSGVEVTPLCNKVNQPETHEVNNGEPIKVAGVIPTINDAIEKANDESAIPEVAVVVTTDDSANHNEAVVEAIEDSARPKLVVSAASNESVQSNVRAGEGSQDSAKHEEPVEEATPELAVQTLLNISHSEDVPNTTNTDNRKPLSLSQVQNIVKVESSSMAVDDGSEEEEEEEAVTPPPKKKPRKAASKHSQEPSSPSTVKGKTTKKHKAKNAATAKTKAKRR